MSAPIKTGAWLHRVQHSDWLRCDLYTIQKVLIARCNPRIVTARPDGDVWATMFDYDYEWYDKGIITLVSEDFVLHYKLVQLPNGAWIQEAI